MAVDLRTKPRPNVLGRDDELAQMTKMRLYSDKHGMLVYGSSGVGKSAIVTEFAHRDNVAVWSLDPAKLLGGTGLRGDMEKRLDMLFDELKARKDDVLFIDEAHAMASLGKSSDGTSVSLLDLIKLRTGQHDLGFKIVFATNEPEAFLRDEAVMRRILPLELKPATHDEMSSIAASMARRYSAVHGSSLYPQQVQLALSRLEQEHGEVTPALVGSALEPSLISARMRRADALEFWRTKYPELYAVAKPLDEQNRFLLKLQHEYAISAPGPTRDQIGTAIDATVKELDRLRGEAITAGMTDESIGQLLHPLQGELDGGIATARATDGNAGKKLLNLVGGPDGPAYVRALAHRLQFGDPEVRRVIGRSSGPMSTDTRALLENVVFRRLQDPRLLEGLKPMPYTATGSEDYQHASTAIREAINNTLWPQRVSGLVKNPELGR
jgi:SpoVK/Ycf46/Vps4 family AAA+-type ATPase